MACHQVGEVFSDTINLGGDFDGCGCEIKKTLGRIDHNSQ